MKFTLRCKQSDFVPIICHRWQICHWYQNTRGKFAAGATTLPENLPPVSATSAVPMANLLPVSLIPVVHLDLRISLSIFEKIQTDPNVIFRGLGEDDS
jgi:hypothetical protein